MFSIKTMNKIAAIGTDRFGANYTVSDNEQNPDGILVRSASLLDGNFNDGLLAIARAGAGVNNIPLDICTSKGIAVFNTPGANANAVKELTIAGLLLSSRRIVDSINWAQTLKGKGDEIPKLVEKGKGNFVGPELEGKKLGVIGLGAIGSLIVNAAKGLNMEVYGYDNFLSVESALRITRSMNRVENVKTIYEECDYITYHVPLNDSTRRYVNKEVFDQMKDGVRICNFSRGEIINEDDLEEALNSGKVAKYVTDFPNERILSMPNVIAIPHLAASTPESEDNCAVMAVDEIKDYLETGNVKNSENFPNVASERSSGDRLCVLHKNIPNMLSQISSVLGEMNINIDFMHSKSRGEIGYALLDMTNAIPESVADRLRNIDGVLLVRVIK